MTIILHTKLHIPQSSSKHLVLRPALLRWLEKGLNIKLTALIAQAGYGKTITLSEWARTTGCITGWVSLDRYDNELVRFWSYVIASFRQDSPTFGESAMIHIGTLEQGKYDSFISALLNELNELPSKRALILDDFHVIELTAIHESLAYFLEFLPPNVHLYIASRSSLPFPAARLQAKGDIRTISANDLRFKMDEAVDFFRNCMELKLSDDEASMIVRQTEGWVSGLHLAAISLRRSNDPSAFIREFNGQHRDIAQYLLEEIFEKQSAEIQRFLLRTSILDRMNAPLSETVTELAGAAALLHELERQNLFISRLDERGEWYRYHHLFADFLLQQLTIKHPEWREEVYARAASWFEQNDSPAEAIELWLTAGRYLDAASLIERKLTVLQDYRTSFLRWLDEIPEQLLAQNPFLQLLHVKVSYEEGKLEWAARKLKSLESRLSDPDWTSWLGSYYFLSAELALYMSDLPASYQYLELFHQHEPKGLGSPLQMIAGNSISGISFESLLSFFHNFYEAEKYFLYCIGIWEEKGHYPFLGYFYCFISDLWYEWDRLDEAEALVKRVYIHSYWQPYSRIWAFAGRLYAQMNITKGNIEFALSLLEQIKEKLNTPDKDFFIRRIESYTAYFCIRAGLTDQVAEWIQTCGMKYTDSIPSFYYDYYFFARALLELGQASEALILSEKLMQLTEEKNWTRDKIKILILRSIAQEQLGKGKEALIDLEATLHLAEPQGFIRSFTDESKALGGMLVRYLQYRQNGSLRNPLSVSLAYVKKLLRLMNVQLQGSLVIPPLLTEQELRILRKMKQGCKNKEIAEQMGISPETVKKHTKNIYQKLEVNSRLLAVQAATELHLL